MKTSMKIAGDMAEISVTEDQSIGRDAMTAKQQHCEAPILETEDSKREQGPIMTIRCHKCGLTIACDRDAAKARRERKRLEQQP